MMKFVNYANMLLRGNSKHGKGPIYIFPELQNHSGEELLMS
jgi:hypothetical protein